MTIYLLIVWRPDAAGDEAAFEVEHRGPVALTGDRADQHEAVLVADECHLTVVRPLKVCHLNHGHVNVNSPLTTASVNAHLTNSEHVQHSATVR